MKLDKDIKGIAYNSKEVKKGYCFVAIKGMNNDGHRFIDDAIKNGAGVIVSDRPVNLPKDVVNIVVKDTRAALADFSSEFFGHPSKKMRIFGITGTNGKTTITYLMESILNALDRKVGVIGTVTWRYSDKSFPAPNTTPMSYDLQRLLSEMNKNGVSDVIIEVSSHALDQGRVGCVDFDFGVFTNLTHDHLDYHKTIEEYFGAKEKLFTEFLALSSKAKKFAIVNSDDEFGKRLVGRLSGYQVIMLTYGFNKGADVRAERLEITIDGNRIKLATPWGKFEVFSGLRGRFNASNAMAAVALAGAGGVPLDVIKKGIENLKNVPGRFEGVPNNKGISVFVDYAHTPDALKNVLMTLKEISNGRIFTVFGCGGDRDRAKRPLMGDVAARFSDAVFVTSDNPRTEDPAGIINEIIPGVKKTAKEFFVESDRRKAIGSALRLARKGDVVLIAGKGHENYQIVGKEIKHFDDKEEARKFLEHETWNMKRGT